LIGLGHVAPGPALKEARKPYHAQANESFAAGGQKRKTGARSSPFGASNADDHVLE
jgi:hypothetical protein